MLTQTRVPLPRCKLPRAGDCGPRLRLIVYLTPLAQEAAVALLDQLKATGYTQFAQQAEVALVEGNLGIKFVPTPFLYKPPPPGGRVWDSVCLMPPDRQDPASTCSRRVWAPLKQVQAAKFSGICTPSPTGKPRRRLPVCAGTARSPCLSCTRTFTARLSRCGADLPARREGSTPDSLLATLHWR